MGKINDLTVDNISDPANSFYLFGFIYYANSISGLGPMLLNFFATIIPSTDKLECLPVKIIYGLV
jgi:hypothetical protein